MGSMFIPLDHCHKENGCLQVLRGSHKMGRIDHHGQGDQQEANLERVEEVSRCARAYTNILKKFNK